MPLVRAGAGPNSKQGSTITIVGGSHGQAHFYKVRIPRSPLAMTLGPWTGASVGDGDAYAADYARHTLKMYG